MSDKWSGVELQSCVACDRVFPVRGNWSRVFNNPEIIRKIQFNNVCTLQMFYIEHPGTNVDFITCKGLERL